MGESGREALEGIHVLVIDFDQHVLDLARAALEPAGALVMTTSAAGVDDVTLIADVILCDLELIEAVGEPFLTALRRKHRARGQDPPAIAFVTGGPPTDDCLRAAGFRSYLTTPFDGRSLVAAVWAVIRR
jgi:DNA-binding response OmpR family regulator